MRIHFQDFGTKAGSFYSTFQSYLFPTTFNPNSVPQSTSSSSSEGLLGASPFRKPSLSLNRHSCSKHPLSTAIDSPLRCPKLTYGHRESTLRDQQHPSLVNEPTKCTARQKPTKLVLFEQFHSAIFYTLKFYFLEL